MKIFKSILSDAFLIYYNNIKSVDDQLDYIMEF